ncbi:MAG TPA: MmcQ/YjbR family DNA-binding protein [Luteitalea sp.]|nr:MmcQ/YjbR family DNA-binding protein [Luteitalea sp.]
MPRPMTSADFRELVLGMEGVAEGAHMGHADFRAGGRVFAGLTADETHATLRLPPDEQATLLASAPAAFEAAAGAWGRQGWTRMDLRTVTRADARSAVLLAWEHTMATPARSRSAKTATPRRSRRS